MTMIFDGANGSDNAGKVVAILPRADFAVGSILQVEDWGSFNQMKSIFTRTSIAQTTNHQFQHTLGERIYINIFGDRIGQLDLGGVSFYDTCAANGGDKKMGITHVLDFFAKAKLSARKNPLKITLDSSTVFQAYLHTVRGEAVGGMGTNQRLFQFNLSLAIPPGSTT